MVKVLAWFLEDQTMREKELEEDREFLCDQVELLIKVVHEGSHRGRTHRLGIVGNSVACSDWHIIRRSSGNGVTRQE